jgi:HK97 family phage major capsid protein
VEFRPTLIMMLEQFGIARNYCTVIPMNRMELEFPTLTDGIQTYWIGEGQTIPKTKPQFGTIKLVAKKLATLIPITSELLDDSTIAIANLIATLIANAMAKEEDRVVFAGKMANSPWDSILYDPNVVHVHQEAGKTSFADLSADQLADMIADLTPMQSDGARWMMHRTVFNVIRKLKDKNDNYIYTSPSSPSEPGTIWGYPYTLNESFPSIAQSAADTPFLFLGNPKHAYIGDRKQMAVAKSEHLGFAEDKIFIRVIQREGFVIALPQALRVLRTAA